ncbi:MAG TPA: VOC family protein [Pseudonocardia sp.]|jgi:extradiol dioxygenase
MSIRCLGYLGVQTPDPASWEPFGTGVLGLAVTAKGDDGTLYLRADERRHRLAIHPGEDSRIRYAGWEVADEAGLTEMIARLDGAGVSWTGGDHDECAVRGVERFVRFTDPAGMPHEIFYGAVVTYDPFVPGRPMQGFVTGQQGFGHIVFIVPDAKAAHEFYTQVMGFRLSDIVDTAFHTPGYFYHCNSRHHSIAVLEVPHMAGLHHLMLEVNSLDDVGIAYDLVQERGYPLSMKLGRHSTDQMLSFYVVSPAGFEIEYGWGGRQVNDETWHVVRADRGELWGHQIVGTGLPDTVRPVAAG